MFDTSRITLPSGENAEKSVLEMSQHTLTIQLIRRGETGVPWSMCDDGTIPALWTDSYISPRRAVDYLLQDAMGRMVVGGKCAPFSLSLSDPSDCLQADRACAWERCWLLFCCNGEQVHVPNIDSTDSSVGDTHP